MSFNKMRYWTYLDDACSRLFLKLSAKRSEQYQSSEFKSVSLNIPLVLYYGLFGIISLQIILWTNMRLTDIKVFLLAVDTLWIDLDKKPSGLPTLPSAIKVHASTNHLPLCCSAIEQFLANCKVGAMTASEMCSRTLTPVGWFKHLTLRKR